MARNIKLDIDLLALNNRTTTKHKKCNQHVILFHLQRRNDREEIRRRLAMGVEAEDSQDPEKLGKKPSLHSRLQSG